MDIVQLYNLTLVHEALQKGEKLRVEDINFVYHTIPGSDTLRSKQGKIKFINDYFEVVCKETLIKYLVDKQIKPDVDGRLNGTDV
jgi:hypothetical protein